MGIWDATTTYFEVSMRFGPDACLARLFVNKSKYDRERAWIRLLQISKMTGLEFVAEWRNGE